MSTVSGRDQITQLFSRVSSPAIYNPPMRVKMSFDLFEHLYWPPGSCGSFFGSTFAAGAALVSCRSTRLTISSGYIYKVGLQDESPGMRP